MLKLDQLRCFAAAVDCGSIAAAGAQLNLSASAIGYNIGALEEQLSAKLLVRRPSSGVSLTTDGRRLMKLARPLIQEVSEIEDIFPGRNGAIRGELIVGCQEGLSWSLVPRAIERISRKHPLLDITLKTVFMDQANAPLIDAEVDVLLTFVTDDEPDPVVERATLCRPAPYAMMRKGHPLDRGQPDVSLAELAAFPQLFIQDGPALDLFAEMYYERELKPKFAMVSNISTSAQAIVGTSDSISLRIIRPAHHLSPLGDALVFIPIADDVRKPYLVAATIRRKSATRHTKVEKFIDECGSLFTDDTMRPHFFY